jgi:tRNA A-37 threonylcarbamoyl transferase component Bud32
MPYLVDALTAARAEQNLRQHVDATARVEAARLVRHKPGRRFLIEYDIILGGGVRKTWIGKSRAKGLDRHTFELQRTLHARVFAEDSPDGICVPSTVGVIPEWQMWLQEKVAGDPLTMRLGMADAPALCARAIAAVNKLHKANVTARKAHGVEDELRILGERLPLVAEAQPELAPAIRDVLARCHAWAARLPPTTMVGIHRDFYPDQIIVSGSRLYLIDLDLYCLGDPALDVGNFLAHLTEMALRGTSDVEALTRCEDAAINSFIRLDPSIAPSVMEAWKKLALARHVHISTQFPDRQAFTRTILEALLRDGRSLDVPHQ